MVIPILKGGLGNQMFQIANAYAYAKRHGFEWGINYGLSFCPNQGSSAFKYRETLYKNLPSTIFTPPTQYAEPYFGFKEIPAVDNILLDGFFQTEKYFKDCSDEVHDLFEFPPECESIDIFLKRFPQPTVGVHVRRGDYEKFANHHRILGSDYYDRAAQMFKDHQSFVCSDDWVSVQKEMSFSEAIKSPYTNEVMDMYLLSQCQNVVMGNSSFSWWSAFLGVKKEKVVAPKEWFGPEGPKEFSDIFRKEWICL